MAGKKKLIVFVFLFFSIFFMPINSFAFWIWTPKSKTLVNPKYAVKDTPRKQYDWAMRFFRQGEFQRAADEFTRLTGQYPDSEWAPEAQYYAGRSYEELAKYLFAFQNYQKTIDNYPYTRRSEEIIERQYRIANIFQSRESSKLVDIELTLSLDQAATIYKKIVENSAFGKYADKSLFNMAECYRRMGEYDKAIKSYERIINDYPESALLAETRYQLAYTKYEASLGAEYDQVSTEEAMKEFKRMSQGAAAPEITDQARKILAELKDKKAGSIIKIAEFYEKQKKYQSALMYYADVKDKFPETESAKYAEEKITKLKERTGEK